MDVNTRSFLLEAIGSSKWWKDHYRCYWAASIFNGAMSAKTALQLLKYFGDIDIKIEEDKCIWLFWNTFRIYCKSHFPSWTFITFGDGGRFSSSEKDGERGFRRLRVGLGVAGGDGDGVVGWDFPADCSESSWRSSCSSEPESSLRESSSSKSSSSPLPCEPKIDQKNVSVQIKDNDAHNDATCALFNVALNEERACYLWRPSRCVVHRGWGASLLVDKELLPPLPPPPSSLHSPLQIGVSSRWTANTFTLFLTIVICWRQDNRLTELHLTRLLNLTHYWQMGFLKLCKINQSEFHV